MDQITTIEDAIIARLAATLKAPGLSCSVLPFPDKNFEDYEPIHSNGEVLVAYTGEDDGEPEDIGLVFQEREMDFELTFIFSSLRQVGKVGGLNAHLEAARVALTGFKPEEATKKLRLLSIERVKRYKKRWWQYTQVWRAVAINLEVPKEELGAKLVKITINTGDRSTDVVAP
jgi:hypothetical protein